MNRCIATALSQKTASERGARQGRIPGWIRSLTEWLTGDAYHSLDDAGLLTGLGEGLLPVISPVARVTLHVRTLNVDLVGRTVDRVVPAILDGGGEISNLRPGASSP
jgi:hypothetical protein